MSDRPIAVGDLVQVLHQCCYAEHIGKIFTVSLLYFGCGKCDFCRTDHTGVPSAHLDGAEDWGFRRSWLKRIPPLDELESTKTDEPMKEPA